MAASLMSRILPHDNDNGDFTPPTPFQILDALLRQVKTRAQLKEWEQDYLMARDRVLTRDQALRLAAHAAAVYIKTRRPDISGRAA